VCGARKADFRKLAQPRPKLTQPSPDEGTSATGQTTGCLQKGLYSGLYRAPGKDLTRDNMRSNDCGRSLRAPSAEQSIRPKRCRYEDTSGYSYACLIHPVISTAGSHPA
jgi:hypothetical protein